MNKKFTLVASCLFLLSSLNIKADEFSYNGLYGGNVNIMGTQMELPDFTKWHYFAFDEAGGVTLKGTSDFTVASNAETVNTEWKARTDWDFAFHAYDFRTNSGAAGNGNAGAAFIADAASAGETPLAEVYANLTQAPNNIAYAADAVAAGNFYLSLSSMPPPRATSLSVSAATRKAASETAGASADFYTFGMSGSAENPMIIILKTPSGKYVKIFLKQFVEDGKPGYLKFDYAFIPLNGGTGLSTVQSENAAIYPNPASDVLNIRLSEAADVKVYNLAGSLVKETKAPAGLTPIPVSGWAKGTYIVKINSEKENR
ncbi:MAG: T9SS type A sorting domain-containing protein, partial [Dysgonamonadaceae bacterium]|nr:T9SS type A sorting domain-containing protein [Dysgonamonadaceae bacterium]